MIEKIMVCGAHHRRADQHRLRGGLESVARAVVFFQVMLGFVEVHVKAKIFLQIRLDVGQCFDLAQLM